MTVATLVERFRVARRDSGLAVLEGFHALKHALRFGAEILDVAAIDPHDVARLADGLAPDVSAPLFALARATEPDTFAVLSPAHVPTGVIGIARRPAVDVASIVAQQAAPPIVLLENANSPYNVGAAVRVAAAAGAAGLFVTGNIDPWSPTALRAGAGLAFALPVARIDELPRFDRPLVAFDPDGDDLTPGILPERAILAFGGERAGLSDALLERAMLRVSIPMRPGVSSMNLATAVAVALYCGR
jgi:RNA methyltransferase, TrmH family